jgi:hypothetical protein
MDSDRASGSDAFALVQHKSRISEASYFDSSSVCSNSRIWHRRPLLCDRLHQQAASRIPQHHARRSIESFAKHSTHKTPMTEKARGAASPPLSARALRKMAHRKCEICRRPGPRFQLLPGRKRSSVDPRLPSYRFPKRLKR